MLFLVGLVVLMVATAAVAVVKVSYNAKALPFVLGGVALIGAWTLLLSVTTISTGHVGVARWFGAVQAAAYSEGLRFINPMYDVTQMSIQRATVDFTDKAKDADGPTVVAVSLDRNPVRVEASFPYAINPETAWKVLQRIGGRNTVERQLIVPAARAAIRDVVAQYAWADASITKRAELEQRLTEETARAVSADLIGLGFTQGEAKSAVTFMPVLLREVLPDAKVLNAIAERVASEEDLKRQKVLTAIAEEIAERRANEGVGVERLFAKLPANFSPSQIREVLLALAEKERADALMKAVETGRVNVLVLPSSTPVALSAPDPAPRGQ
jgi:regulator of protease activity HflC (stomatin/prohibitin superfamily)